ncbi:MAG: aromatic ring-hydroxylating dioxygenase subunit alpha [Proteobacteria bacterium]|nr:aromatic ring-hydroxylating dioxygenase subunit alpha [Pseudomonadota bacterium]
MRNETGTATHDPSVGARRRHLPLADSAEGKESSCGDADGDLAFLDPAIYCDPAHFERERQRLFLRLPLCLGHIDQLASGSALAREICGVPVLITRARDGEAHVFLNVCRHRGARVLPEQETVCRKQSLACPYHNWTYRLDGSLAGIPRAEAFPDLDTAQRGLRALPSAVRHGLIFAVLDPEAGPIDAADHLGGLDPDLDAIGMGRHRFYRQHTTRRATNWKLIVDAFLEVYHVTRLHAGTIGPFFEDSVSAADPVGRHLRYLVARETTNEIRTLPAERWSPQRHATMVHLLFPNSVIVYHPDYISHLGMFPTAADETLFVHTMLIPERPNDEKAETHWARSFELMDSGVFNGEDLVVCEQIQRGLSSGANERLVLGRLEQNLRWFHAEVGQK